MPKLTKYIPSIPTVKQHAFLLLTCRDAFYGGAAGGGKSEALLMASLQYVDYPGYNAIILRNTFQNLSKPEGLIPRSHEWLTKTDATWNSDLKRWLFPSGATLSFGYLDSPEDHFNYQGAGFQFVGIDEVCQIRKEQALYLFSRLRRTKDKLNIPIRFRCTSNPPAPGQLARGSWVKTRYIDEETREERVFIPAWMEDNPYLDCEEYGEALENLDPVTRAQLRDGNWEIQAEGGMFKEDWFRDQRTWYTPDRKRRRIRFWDLASSRKDKKNKDPDWTVGALISFDEQNLLYIEDVVRERVTPAEAEDLVKKTAEKDVGMYPHCDIFMEQEPGSAGVNTISTYSRRVLAGYSFYGFRSTGPKIEYARPFSAYCEKKQVHLCHGPWISFFIDEAKIFPNGKHDDIIDAVAKAFCVLAKHKKKTRVWGR